MELTERSAPLSRFTHPISACYLLGAEDHGLPKKILDRCNFLVQVGGLRVCLNVATVGALVLYDRQSKRET